jgi:hypothetical protein
MTGNNSTHVTFQVYTKIHGEATPFLSVASDKVM